MWHFGSKYQKIGTLVKVNCKQLKAILVSWIRNFGPTSIVSKLIEFSLFDNFFLDLAKFQDFNVFLLFNFLDLDNFSNFLIYSTLFIPTPNPSTLPSLLFLPKTDLLLLFLLEADLLGFGLSGNPVNFNIEMSGTAILLKS